MNKTEDYHFEQRVTKRRQYDQWNGDPKLIPTTDHIIQSRAKNNNFKNAKWMKMISYPWNWPGEYLSIQTSRKTFRMSPFDTQNWTIMAAELNCYKKILEIFLPIVNNRFNV